jgi:hypothetical protein
MTQKNQKKRAHLAEKNAFSSRFRRKKYRRMHNSSKNDRKRPKNRKKSAENGRFHRFFEEKSEAW